MVFYESPYRLLRTLEQFSEIFGPERECSVAREISKIHETHHRGTLASLVEYFRENEPKGEIVIVVAGAAGPVRGEHKNKYKEEKDCGERQSEKRP